MSSKSLVLKRLKFVLPTYRLDVPPPRFPMFLKDLEHITPPHHYSMLTEHGIHQAWGTVAGKFDKGITADMINEVQTPENSRLLAALLQRMENSQSGDEKPKPLPLPPAFKTPEALQYGKFVSMLENMPGVESLYWSEESVDQALQNCLAKTKHKTAELRRLRKQAKKYWADK